MFQEVRNLKRSSYRVLLIDSNVDQLDILLSGFEILGERKHKNFEVNYHVCNRSDIALESLEEEIADIVVIDSNTTGIPTLIFLEKVKRTYPDIKVIVVSADELSDYATKATNLGAYSFIKKPYGLEECFNFISNCLDKVHGERVQARVTERYRRFMEQSSLGIMHLKTNGEVLNVNDAFLEFFKVSTADLVGYNLMCDLESQLTDKNFVKLTDCLNMDRVFTSRELLISTDHFFKPCSSMYFDFSLYGVKEDGEMPILVAMFFNDTENVKSKLQLEKSKEAESNALKVKTEFLVQMGHELRTPLHSILGYGDLIHSQVKDFTIKEYSSYISGASKHLLELLNEILETSKIEFDKIAEERSTFDIRSLFNELKYSFQSSLVYANVQLELEFSLDLPEQVVMDRSKLRWLIDQILHVALVNLENKQVDLKLNVKDSNLIVLFCSNDNVLKELFLREFDHSEHLQNRAGLKASIFDSYLKALSGRYFFIKENCITISLPMGISEDILNDKNSKDELQDEALKNKEQRNIVLTKNFANHLLQYISIGDVNSLEKEIQKEMDDRGSNKSLEDIMVLVKNFDLKILRKVLDDNRNR